MMTERVAPSEMLSTDRPAAFLTLRLPSDITGAKFPRMAPSRGVSRPPIQ